MSRLFTREEFASMTPKQKGYAVYMFGARKDQPNIPETYTPSLVERSQYERGQLLAVMDAQDSA